MNQKLGGIIIFVTLVLVLSIVLLFTKNSQLTKQLDVVSTKTENVILTIQDRVESLERTSSRVEGSIDSLQTRSKKQGDRIATQTKQSEENREAITSWKDELTSQARSMITEEMISKGTEQAVMGLANNNSLIFGQKFIDGVASALATDYKSKLRGDPGIDANNESVAKLLLADRDFLNRVSVSVLLGVTSHLEQGASSRPI